MTDPVQPDAWRGMSDDVLIVLPEPPPPRQPLGRVARIFHRRGMWSLSADMLAQSADPDETPAQAKASDDSAPPQP